MKEPGRGVTIRPADRGDIVTILTFIRELAEFERLAHLAVADTAALDKALFGSRIYAECLMAEDGGESLGFALFFHNFSTFTGKPGLYLEDLYVRPAYRRRGVGLALFRELAKIALARDCARLEWAVLDWNEKALRFYRGLGAEPLDDWTVQRLTREKMEKLARA